MEEASTRDWAVRDYKRHLKRSKRLAPTSVNQALAAIDNFYRSLGAGRPDVGRERLPSWHRAPWLKQNNAGSSERCRPAPRPGTGLSARCSSVGGPVPRSHRDSRRARTPF